MRWLVVAFAALTLLSGCEDTGQLSEPVADHRVAPAKTPEQTVLEGPQAELIWVAPQTRADGAPLQEAPGFKVHIGRTSGNYDSVLDVGKVTSYTISGLEPGVTYFAAVSAYDTPDRDSQLSEEIVFSTNATSGTAPVRGADYIIGTGRPGGGYHVTGTRLRDLLKAQGSTAEVLATSGSLENLQRLRSPSSPVNLVFSQADALNYFLKDHPDSADRFLTVDSWGSECVFIVTRRDSGIETDGDLQSKADARMAILSPESGVSVTFRNMSLLEPAFDNILVLYMDTLQALENLSAPGKGRKVDAVMLVQHPKARPPEMQTVLDDFGRYNFVQIKDNDLRGRLPDGTRVYSHVEITPEPMSGIGVQTICTKRLMLASRDKLKSGQAAALSSLVKERWRDIYVAH